MSQVSLDPDVVVVGAGAAGLAASRELRRANVPHLVLEARNRVGGRAWTDSSGTRYPLDLGCEWLHSADRNVLAKLAPTLGHAIDKREPPWRRRHPQPNFSEADQAVFGGEMAAFHERLEKAGAEARRTGNDRAAATLLDPKARFNGLLDAVSTYYNGAPLSRVSIIDFDRYCDTEEDWRVEGGYGSLIADAGAGLPVRLGCRVTRIDARGRAIRVETEAGTLEAAGVIVTVPTAVLASGAITFDPALDDHLHAAANLPLGLANKVYFRLEGAEAFAPDTRLVGEPSRRDTGSYTLRPRGRDLVEGYFGGDYARRLEAGGLPAFVEAARREIGEALGHDLGRRLTPVVATAWALDPFAMGSYSHALPGHADDRAVLASAVDDRIAFAGEATSPEFFSTAHGAFEEGTRAAQAMAGALKTERGALNATV